MSDSDVALSEQIVIVTGAGRGLGSSIARAFAREGARVVINYRRSREPAESLARQVGDAAMAVQADVTDRQQVTALVESARQHFGAPVTTVVYNALVDFSFNADARPTVHDITGDAMADQFHGCVQGALNTTQAALPQMRAQGFGRIINIGSNLFQRPVVPYHDYTAAKAALLSLTRTVAAELGPDGITVNMVSGGLLRTTDASAATPDDVFETLAATTPLRRVITVDEFADAAVFFASQWARATTGQNLIVDGGLVPN